MLTDVQVRALKPKDKQYKVADSEGLYIVVNTTGSKLWRLKYRFHGIEKTLSIGKYPQVSINQARLRRSEAKELIALTPAWQSRSPRLRQPSASRM
ncbi:Arm DNA-binding domain-containing protein [Limnobacter sp.]|uniref:Arm DNA-binding domain-containing protein n=1 Tax=Limnobacter sp. TaxID=2003368 RepID=UPI003FA571ED